MTESMLYSAEVPGVPKYIVLATEEFSSSSSTVESSPRWEMDQNLMQQVVTLSSSSHMWRVSLFWK